MTKVEQSSSSATGGPGPVGGGTGPRHPGAGWWIIGLVAVVAVVALVAAVVGVVVTSGTNKSETQGPAGVVATSLTTAITAEQQAKATYDNVIARFGPVQPFATVRSAEVDHIDTLQGLAQRYGVTLPTGSSEGQLSPTTRLAACQLGVISELALVATYTQLLTRVSAYPDLTRAFSNLRAAARDNHLPAFEACLSASSPPGPTPGSSVTTGSTTGSTTGAPTASTTVVASLGTAYTAEQQAKATYDNVIARFGPVRPFTTVRSAEVDHIDTLQGLAQRYGVTLPAGPFNGAPSPATLTEACQLGVTTEQQIVSTYSQLITQVAGYADLTQAFSNLQAASRDNHLPAFQRCA